jgi:hypothetical protein
MHREQQRPLWSLATFLIVRFSRNDVRFTPKSGHVRCNE